MNNVAFWGRVLIELCCPIIKNTVLFRSFTGQYNDNPKYISEKLHEKHPELNIVWVAGKDTDITTFPDYAKTITLGSKEFAKYIARAEVVVDNYSGCRTTFLSENNFVKRVIFSLTSGKKKGQFNLSTWHGTPLKHIALDEPAYKSADFVRIYCNSDMLMSGCELTSNAYKTAFMWKKPILMKGTPRNDLMFSNDTENIKKKLGLPADKKVVMFAPTFRESVEMSGVFQMSEINTDKLFSALSEKFGGEWCFVFRSHNLVMSKICDGHSEILENVINGNEFPDMAEYLACTDLLITDYSSSMFDYSLSGKPCMLYAPDLANYKNVERGFYIDIDTLPYPLSESFSGLIENINGFDSEIYNKKVNEFLRSIGNTEFGGASEAAVLEIEKHIKSLRQNLEE